MSEKNANVAVTVNKPLSDRERPSRVPAWACLLLAFFIPFLFMFICFAIKGVSPFGDKQILVTDLWHQYYPFLVDYQSKLQHGGSLLWTWKSGGGTNYIALMSYYLASPLNVFSVFVPAQYLREFLYVITCIKIGCAGLFFAWFLRMTFRRADLSLPAFGTMYALCAFIMGYYWNVIWLDTIALLPLVIAGTVALLRHGRYKLYIIALALSILANYYIGLFTCIFIVLVCLGYFAISFKGVRSLLDTLIGIGKMAGASLISVMITAAMTVPAYLALKHTHSADNSFPTTFSVNMGVSADFNGVLEGIGKTIANSVAFVNPTTREGLPNVYCGVFVIFLAILFLTCPKIKIRERLYCGNLVLFFILSYIIRQLDFVMHGFHFPNMLPHRFSFLMCFVMIYMAYRVYMHIDSIKLYHIIIAVVGFAIVIIVASPQVEIYSTIVTAIIGFVTAVWVLLVTLKVVPTRAFAIALFIIAIAEGACSAYIGVETTTVTDALSYPLGTTRTAECVDVINQLEEDNVDLPRAEVTHYHTLNDNALIGIDGISMFNSMTNEAITNYYEKFGICGWPASNRYTYQESSPFTNMMLNIKYLISPQGKALDSTHNTLIHRAESVTLQQNDYYLPQGFMVGEDLLKFDTETAPLRPLDNQNQMFRYATGLDGDLYEQLDVVSQGHSDYEIFKVTKNGLGNYSYSKETTDGVHFKFNYEAPRDGVAVAYFSCSGVDNVSLRINDSEVDSCYIKRPYIMTFGDVHQGDKISLYADLKSDASSSGGCEVYCAMVNEDLFQQGYDKLKEHTLKATKVTDTEISGNIDAGEGGLFYTSISYVTGWHAYVDGKEVEITPVGDAMLAFKLDKGPHIITLRYFPEGMKIGIIVTVVGLLLFGALIALEILIKKRKAKKEENKRNEKAVQEV